MAGMPGIVIEIGADTKNAIDAVNRMRGELGDSLGTMDKFKAGVDKAFVPALAIIGGAAAAGIAFANAAAEDAKNAEILAVALRKNAGATDANIAATEAWITTQGKQLGFADDQLRPALGALVRATGDVAEAQKAASLAMDIATATGKPLEAVSASLAKAYAGNTGALGKLVPGIDKGILASKDMVAIQGELAKAVGGSASAAAETAAGKMARFKLSMDETKESIGAALLPVLEKLQPVLASFAEWAQNNTPLIVAIGGAIVGLAAAVVIAKIAMEAWTVATAVFNAVLAANPIVLIILAIVALVAIVVIAYNKFDWFKAGVDAVWTAIQSVISGFVEFFQTFVMPAISFVINAIVLYFQAMFTAYKIVWDAVYFVVEKVVTWFRDTVAPAFKKAIDAISGFFAKGIEAIKDIWNGIFDFFSGLVGKWLAIGTAIVDGIRQGISNAWEAFKNWVGNLFGGIVDSVKGIFGINSPSRVFADMGKQIVAGWQNGLAGFDGVNNGILNSARGLVNDLPTASNGGFGSQSFGTASGMISDEMLARALARLLSASDARNGVSVATL